MFGIEKDAIIFADGKGSSGPTEVESNAIKIIRLNSKCALGFGGNVVYGNQVFALMMRRPDLIEKFRDSISTKSIVPELKDHERDDLDFYSASKHVEFLTAKLREKVLAENLMQPRFFPILIGRDERRFLVQMWFSSSWDSLTYTSDDYDSLILPAIPKGGNQQEFDKFKIKLERELRKKKVPLFVRMKKVIDMCARRSPESVNNFISYARATEDFEVKTLHS